MKRFAHPRLRTTALLGALLISFIGSSPALAQESGSPAAELPGFGMEFEFAGVGNRIPTWENQNFDNFRNILGEVARQFGDTAAAIDKELHKTQVRPDGTIRQLWRAVYVDPHGRQWRLEPEYVATGGLDGYELVTPPLARTAEIRQVLDRVRSSGLVREGLKSGVHLHVDGRRLVGPNGNATGLINLINMHESMEPMLRRIFNPVRGGGHSNRFATPIFMEHPNLLRRINALGEGERTVDNLVTIFEDFKEAEMRARGFDTLEAKAWEKMWKYHSLNLVNILGINEVLEPRIGTVEFRMFDLDVRNPESHERAAELYRRMVAKSAEMAARGEIFEWDAERMNPDRVPPGEDPGRHLISTDANEVKEEARRFVEFLGADAERFEPLLERNIRPFEIPTSSEFDRRLRTTADGRIEINGRAVTMGWELEGRGPHVVLLMRPKGQPELEARWDGMSNAEKMAEFTRQGENISRFEMDTGRNGPWLSSRIHREGTGNWEIESEPLENMREVLDRMRWVKKKMGGDGRGFHLHMRWAPEREVMRENSAEITDWFNRAADAIFLRRLEVMKHSLSMNTGWNKRFDQATMAQIEEAVRMGNTRSEKARTIAWRPGGSGENAFLDIEIRGLWTRVNDIESVARMLLNAFKNHNWGNARLHDNFMPFEDRVGGRTLPELVAEWAEKVAGRRLTPAELRILENMARHDSEWGRKVTGLNRENFTRNMLTPLLGWENEAGLEETVRRDMRFAKEEFLREILGNMDRVARGEHGLDVNSVNRNALVDRFGLSEADADRLIEHRNRITMPNGFEVNEASAEELRRINGVGEGTARRVREFIEAGNRFESEADFDRAGIGAGPRNALLEAMTNPLEEARFIRGLEELREAGVSEEGIERLRSQGAMGENINANEVFRRNRATVKRWANNALLADHMFRSLLPIENENNRLPNPRLLELRNLSNENLREIGISAETIGFLGALREANAPATVENLRSPVQNFDLERASVEDIRALEGVRTADANRIEAFRNLLRNPPSLDLNTASREQLMELPGVNAEAADKMLEARASGTTFENQWSLPSGLDNTAKRALQAVLSGAEGNHSRTLELADVRRLPGVSEGTAAAIEGRIGQNVDPVASADVDRLLRETNIPLTNERAGNERAGHQWHPLRGEVTGMTENLRNAVGGAFPGFHWLRSNAENLGVTVSGEAEPKIEARITPNSVGSQITISNGLLDKISAATEGMPEAEAAKFRSQAITMLTLDAVNKATSMDLNVENGVERSGVFGQEMTTAEAERMRELYRAINREVPRDLDRMILTRGGSRDRTSRGTGVLPEGTSNENLRRVRNRARTRGNRTSRGR